MLCMLFGNITDRGNQLDRKFWYIWVISHGRESCRIRNKEHSELQVNIGSGSAQFCDWERIKLKKMRELRYRRNQKMNGFWRLVVNTILYIVLVGRASACVQTAAEVCIYCITSVSYKAVHWLWSQHFVNRFHTTQDLNRQSYRQSFLLRCYSITIAALGTTLVQKYCDSTNK